LTGTPAAGTIAGLTGSSLRRVLAGAFLVLAVSGCGGQSLSDPVLQNLVTVTSSWGCASQPVRLLSPRQTPAAPVGFARLASERASIGCTPTRTEVVYFSFRSRRQLRAALRRYRQVLRRHLCDVGRAVFFYATLYDASAAYYTGDFCYRMGGQPLVPF
jgi:hypothetical protein